MKPYSWFTLFFVLLANSFALSKTPNSDVEYKKVFPQYVQYCGFTSLEKKPGYGANIVGGNFGHGALYIHGACKDRTARYVKNNQTLTYPKIKVCDSAGPESGVGISVSSSFKNVNWVAVEDRSFFFHGLTSPNQYLSHDAYLKTEQKAMALGILNDVEIHENLYKSQPENMDRETFKYEDSYGTDWAINNARHMYCLRFPVTTYQLEKMVDYLNQRNESFVLTGTEYIWKITDSCVTTTDNALAAAGFRSPRVGSNLITSGGNIAVPLNNFVTLMDRFNDFPLTNIGKVFSDSYARHMIVVQDQLPIIAGTTSEIITKNPSETYVSESKGNMLDFPVLEPNRKKMELYKTADQYRILKANLQYHKERLEKLILRFKKQFSNISLTTFIDREKAFKSQQEFGKKYFQVLLIEYARIQQNIRLLEKDENAM